jgi:hypothetical protein
MATTIDQYSLKVDTRDAQRSLQGFSSELAKLGGIIAGAVSLGALVNVSRTFEDLRTSLKILYGTASEGNKVFADIQNFAKTSVFSVNDLTNTVIKLKAAGLDPTIAQLRLFADVSSVAADSVGALQAITDLYARTTEGGLGLEDLNRLADRGIPVFKILGEQLGIGRLEISKLGQSAEGAQLILQALEQGLGKTFGGSSQERAKNLSQAMSNFGDIMSNLADTIGTTGMNEGLARLISSFGNLLESLRPLAALIGVGLGAAFNFLAENIKIATAAAIYFTLVLSVNALGTMIGAVVKLGAAFNIFNGIVGKNPLVKLALAAASVGAAFLFTDKVVKDNADSIDELNATLDNFGQGPGAKGLAEGTLASGFGNLRGQVAGLNEELKKFRVELEYNTKAFANNNQEIINGINLEGELLTLSKGQADIKRAAYDLEKRSLSEIRNLEEQRAKLTKEEMRQGRGAIIDEQILKIKQLTEADQQRIKTSMESNQRQARQFDTGWAQAFTEYVENATNAAQQAQRIFQTLTQSMEDMLMGFFKTGKFGWKDFVQNIVDVMLRSQIQQLIAKTFGGVGSIGGGAGGGGLFGGAIIPGFLASGGPAGAGKPYIVGERGPELFVPNISGTVVPNNALGGAPVTYNINAVDAMSFKQMLAQDPSFLHAVAEQGRRRLPGAR